jgi:ATP-dependent RNA helicase DeaD
MAAKLRAEWSPAPSAEEIHTKDGERILESAVAMLDEMPEETDLVLGRRLLEGRNPEALAAALVRQLRAPLPAPEELAAPPAPRGERDDRRPAPRDGASSGEGVWFRLNVGRNNQADPRWILPFLCRRGHVTREAIGRIRILDRETRFEVAPYLAERFAIASAKPGEDDAHIRIEPAASMGPADRPAHASKPRAAYQGKPRPAEGGRKRPTARGPRS